MILFLISVCRILAMSVLHMSGILYRVSLHQPVQKKSSLALSFINTLSGQIFLQKFSKLISHTPLIADFMRYACQQTYLLSHFWPGRYLSLSGLFCYVFPPSLCIQSCSLMTFTEILSIFIFRGRKNSHVILLEIHNTYMFWFVFFLIAFPAAEMGAHSVGPEELQDTHSWINSCCSLLSCL